LAHFVEFDRYLMPAKGTAGRWIATFGAACAIALAYFLAAQLGLSLLDKPSDVAVFWPASGIAAAILIAAGRRVGVALVVGVVVGTVAANLMSDRSLSTSILKGFCNAGEAVLLAWLLDRWFGWPFTFCDLRRVGGFFTAVGISVSISAVGGAAIMTTLQTAAPFWDVWRTLFLSDAVGISVIAPLLIELGQLTNQRRSRAESIEGAGTVVLIALASIYAVTFPTGTWLTFDPDAIVFPLLLWLAARNQQPFAIAGAFAISIAVICATTYGIGHFGDVTLPIIERAQGAQVVATMVTAFTLVLTAIFAERGRSENALRQREAELGEGQRLAHIGSWYWDAETDVVVASDELLRIFGLDPATDRVPTLSDQRGRWYPDNDWERLKTAVQGTMRTGVGYELELQAFRNEIPIWITARGAAVRHSKGQIVGLRGTVQDVTKRKHAELALAEQNLQLRLAEEAGLVGSYTYDTHTDIGQISPGYAAIHGYPDGTTEITRSEWLAHVHPEDVERLQLLRSEALRERQGEYKVDYRIVRCDGEVRWIESRVFILYGSDTSPHRLNGVNIDVTERRRAEQDLVERNILLALAGRAARVGTFAYDTDTEVLQISEDYAAIHGLPEGTAKIARSEWLTCVHPQDVERVELPRSEAFREQRNEYSAEFRIIRPGGEVRWVEIRCFITYDGNGHPKRVVGVSTDVTDRKQAELRLAERNAQFGLAQKATRVGTYTYDNIARTMQLTEASAAILGLPQGITEIAADDWRLRVHPDDVQRLAAERRHAFKERQPELVGELRIIRPTGEVRWIEARALITYGGDGRPCSMIGVYIDVTERKRAEEGRKFLNAELDHRVKNALATVTAVISHTRQGSRSVAEFASALEGRIRSMAATHELLSAHRWSGISLEILVRRELTPYANSKNIKVSGPYVVLRPEAGRAIAMVIHELATNAAKHGALSSKKGRVSIQWDRGLNGRPHPDLALEWQEIGGPPVSTPANSGYGTSTIRDLIPYEFGGTVDLVFAQEGVRCRLKLPADWLSDAGDPGSGAIADAAAK
jgi:PAS domain S-box-containing protein